MLTSFFHAMLLKVVLQISQLNKDYKQVKLNLPCSELYPIARTSLLMLVSGQLC